MIKTRVNKSSLYKYIGYEPMEAQSEVHFSSARFKVDVSGRRRGKSYGAARECLPSLLIPGTRGAIIAPTYDLCDKTMREIDKVLFKKLKMPTFVVSRIRGNLRYAKLKLGPTELHASEVWARSADNPDSILGEGYDWVIVDEAARVSKAVIEQYIRPTLTERKGWALYVSTPNGFNWFYDCYLRGQSNENQWSEWESWRHPSSVSPYLPPEEILAAQSEMAPEFFDQEYMAKFTSFAGQVYGDFNREIHGRMLIDYDPRYDLYCSIDFGYRMPAVVWGQIIRTGQGAKLVAIDEIIHRTRIATPELKRQITERNQRMNYKVTKYFCDPAGRGMQSTTGKNDLEIFEDRMYSNESMILHYRRDPAAVSVDNGVKLLRALIYNAAGKVSFFVSNRCKGLIIDLEAYRYPEHKDDLRGQPPENPVKDGVHDHGCDAVRLMAVNLASEFKNLVYIKGLVN